MKDSPYSYLMGLAVADLSVLTLSFMHYVFSCRIGKGVYAWQVYDAYIFLPLANVFANASVWITVMLTTERWISVKFPLKAKDLCTRSLARKAIFTTFILSFLINIPRFLCQTIELRGVEYQTNSTWFESSEFYEGVTWFYVFLIHIIPLLLLVSLNSCLIALVYQADRRRNELQVSHRQMREEHAMIREQTRLTVTCISIIVLFLVCIIPSAFSNRPVAYTLFGRGMTLANFLNTPFYQVLKVITNTLVFCNLSLNFVLYCVFNNKFRRTLKYLCQDCMHHLIHRGEQKQRHRLSRRSSSSSSSYIRGTNAHGFRRSTGMYLRGDNNLMLCHAEAYPLTRNIYNSRRLGSHRHRLELTSVSEVSDAI